MPNCPLVNFGVDLARNYGDLQSEILPLHKHQFNWKTFQFSHVGHVTGYLSFPAWPPAGDATGQGRGC